MTKHFDEVLSHVPDRRPGAQECVLDPSAERLEPFS